MPILVSLNRLSASHIFHTRDPVRHISYGYFFLSWVFSSHLIHNTYVRFYVTFGESTGAKLTTTTYKLLSRFHEAVKQVFVASVTKN